jgi:hypothetical protein
MKRGPTPSYREKLVGCQRLVADAIVGLDRAEESVRLLLQEVAQAEAVADRNDHRKRLVSAGKRLELSLVQLRLVNIPRPQKGEES